MQWLNDNEWLAWVGLALILAAFEAATVTFVFLMLAGGALAGALAAILGANGAVQVITAVVVAAVLLALIRPVVRSRFMDSETNHGIGAPSLVGRSARVLEPVTEYDGRIKLGGETWSARVAQGGRRCEPGEDVRVLSIDGATAIVVASGDPTTD